MTQKNPLGIWVGKGHFIFETYYDMVFFIYILRVIMLAQWVTRGFTSYFAIRFEFDHYKSNITLKLES